MATSLNDPTQGLNAVVPPSGVDEDQLKANIKAELKPEIKAELTPEIKTELKPEIKAELKPEIKAELKPELTAELKPIFFKPEIESISPQNFIQNITHVIEIRGSYFTRDLTVTANNPQVTLSPVQFVSSDLVKIPLICPSIQSNIILTFNNGIDADTQTIASDLPLNSVPNTWIDLRDSSGLNFTTSTATNADIRIRTGMTAVRDANGYHFIGREPINSVAHFRGTSFRWTRGQNRTLSLIFGISTDIFGIGIGDTRFSNINGNNQPREWEIGLYFAGIDELIEFVGESGRNQRVNGGALDDQIRNYRLEITNDGGTNGVVTLHQLPDNSIASWEIIDPVVIQEINNNTFRFRGRNLFPIIMPQPDTKNYITAIRII